MKLYELDISSFLVFVDFRVPVVSYLCTRGAVELLCRKAPATKKRCSARAEMHGKDQWCQSGKSEGVIYHRP